MPMGKIKKRTAKKTNKKMRTGTERGPSSARGSSFASVEPKSAVKLFVSDLSPEHPLERCVVNPDWKNAHMASIVIARETGSGLTAVGFLVDLWGFGLKDAFIHTGMSRASLDRLLAKVADDGEWVECPLPLAQELVYGGLTWARKHGFRTLSEVVRCLEILPAPEGDPDISRFGTEGGSPLLVLGTEPC